MASDPFLSAFIPRRWWQLALAGLGLISVALLLVAAAHYGPAAGPQWQRLVSQFLTLDQPRAAHWFSLLLLFASAQLAAVIGWCRSRSPWDFDGRYRVWAWSALSCMVWSFALHTGACGLLSELLVPFLNVPPSIAARLGWLLPVSIVAVPLGWGLDREMRGCSSSRWMFRLAMALLAVQAVGPLVIDVAALPFGRLCELALELLAQVAVCFALLLHASYVIHHSADPPREPSHATASWRTRWLSRWLRSPERASDEIAPSVEEESASADDPTGEDAEPSRRRARKPKRSTSSRRRKTTRARQTAEDEISEETESDEPATEEESGFDVAEIEPEAEDSPAPADEFEDEPQSPVATDTEEDADGSAQEYRVDEPPSDPFKGLSKRQRRELRKKMREQERTGQQDE